MAQVQIQQITRISPCKLTNGDYVYEEEIIVGADALRYRNGKKKNSCVMGLGTHAGTDNQVVIGKYNATSTDALFVIGSGTSTSSKKNIVEVKSDKVVINGQLETSNNIIAKTDLSVANQITAKDLTINNTATIKGKLTAPSLSVGANFIVPSNGAITVNSSTIFGAPVNFRLSVTVDSNETLTVDHLKNTSGKYYITTDCAYSKSEIIDIVNDINKQISQTKQRLENSIQGNYEQQHTQISNLYSEVNEIKKRLNAAIDIIDQLCDKVVWLGKNPTKSKTFSFSVLRPLT